MPRFEITGPDGAKYQVDGPEGATEQDALAQVQKQIVADADAAEPNPMLRTEPTLGAPTAKPTPPFDPGALTRTVEAARQGWEGGSHPLTPEYERRVDEMGPLGRFVVNPLARLVLGVPSAAFRGGQQAVMETVGQLTGSPGLGRDVAALPEALAGTPQLMPRPPTAAPETAPVPRINPLAVEPQGPPPAFVPPEAVHPPPVPVREPPPAPPPAAAPRPDVFVPPRPQEVPLAEQGPMPANAFAPKPEPVPATVGGMEKMNPDGTWSPVGPNDIQQPGAWYRTTVAAQPEPQSAGAAASRQGTPSGLVDMTPAETQAYRSTAEGQKLLERQEPGVPDPNVYVDGVNPNLAEIEQSVTTARELKSLGIKSTEVSQEARDIAAAHNDQRIAHLERTIKSPVDVMNARDARAAQAEADLAATWKGKQPADAQPVIDTANEIKASPDGRRPVVRNAVDSVTKELFDADGKLITDPEQLYGVRKHLDDLMSKEAGADDPKSVRAMANLQELKRELDAQIEAAAPGFQQYLRNFADASRKIDEMEVLQGHERKLYDAQNRIGYAKVQALLRQIVDRRQAPGLNPYKSISEETMARLWALRDDLRRSASAKELASAPGSDTAQNAWDLAKGLGGQAVLHGGANVLAPGIGSVAVGMAKQAIDPILSAARLRKATRRGMEILRPNRFAPPEPPPP